MLERSPSSRMGLIRHLETAWIFSSRFPRLTRNSWNRCTLSIQRTPAPLSDSRTVSSSPATTVSRQGPLLRQHLRLMRWTYHAWTVTSTTRVNPCTSGEPVLAHQPHQSPLRFAQHMLKEKPGTPLVFADVVEVINTLLPIAITIRRTSQVPRFKLPYWMVKRISLSTIQDFKRWFKLCHGFQCPVYKIFVQVFKSVQSTAS